MIEAVTNTFIGFVISLAATIIVLPLFGQYPSFNQSAGITICFTFISLTRQYVLRRLFNSILPPRG